MTVTLINTFVVPAEVEAEFVATWRGTIDHFATAPGFIDTRLHRNTGGQDTAHDYVNIAHWESEAAYLAVFDGFVPAGQRIPGVLAHPGLFEVVAEVTG
jgi:heme-degrading monooxygenase HmoA